MTYINIYPFIHYSDGITHFILFLFRLTAESEFRNFGDANEDEGNFVDVSQLIFAT